MQAYHIPLFITTLESLEPLQLEAVSLLNTLRPRTGEWFPTTLSPDEKAQVIAATVELVDYTRRCSEFTQRLKPLPPIPLVAWPCLDVDL